VEVTFDADEVRKLLAKTAATQQNHVVSEARGQDVIGHMDYLTTFAKTLRKGMTHHEVAAYMGENPRAVDESRWLDIAWWNYGSVWVALWHSSKSDTWTVNCLAPVPKVRTCWTD